MNPPVRVNDAEGQFLTSLAAQAQTAAHKRADASVIVEIGSAAGYSALALAAGAPKTRVVCIDPWTKGSVRRYKHSRTLLEFLAATRGQAITPIVEFSYIVALWWRHPIALLHIDGDHSQAGALGDYLNFAQHIPPDGLFVLHDYPKISGVRECVDDTIRPSGLWDIEWTEHRFWCARRNANPWKAGTTL